MLANNIIKNKFAFMKVYSVSLVNNLQKKGFLWACKKALLKIIIEVCWLLSLPLLIFIHLLGFRKLAIRVEHVGHLTTEIDTFIKAKILGLMPKRKYFILAPNKKVANRHVLDYWDAYVPIIKNDFLCQLITIATHHFFINDRNRCYTVNHFGTQPIYKINQAWGDKPPLLKLKGEDENLAKTLLAKLGINDNQWFVCVHVRESGYIPSNEFIQSHRNASISNSFLAIDEIIRRGGVVVRMGDSSMCQLSEKPGLIDYAHHELKSPQLDVILCAKARFFLGCTSGLAFLSSVFGVPIAQSNMIPVETLGIGRSDISIPKLLCDMKTKRLISFERIFSSDIGGYFYSPQYSDANIEVIENTPDEIHSLVVEMMDKLDGVYIDNTFESNLHRRYISYFKEGHYSFGAASSVCKKFLLKHKELINYMNNVDHYE